MTGSGPCGRPQVYERSWCERRRRNRDADGFTIVELLVVLSLLGILATVAVFSASSLADRAPQLADATTDRDVELRCEAARGGLLSGVSGCVPAPAPAALPPPELGPIVTTIEVAPASSSTTTYVPLDVDVVVRDQAGERYGAEGLDEGATLRWEVTGVAAQDGTIGPTSLGGASAGEASFTYTQSAGGVDTIRVCALPDGTEPASCDDREAVVGTATHTWILRPYRLASAVQSGRSVDVTWTTSLSSGFDLAAYAVYDDAGCTGTPRRTGDDGATRSIVGTGSNPTTTTVRLNWGTGPQPFNQPGYLSIAAGAETSVGGSANVDVTCVAFGQQGDGPASITISPTSGSSEVVDGAVTFTAVVLDAANEPLPDASVRWTVDGDTVATATTDGNGAVTLDLLGDVDTTSTIRACTTDTGSTPLACDVVGVIVDVVTWSWLDEDEPPPPPDEPPVFVSWTRVNNSTITVVWDGVITAAGPLSNYRVYTNQGQCNGDSNARTPSGRSAQVSGTQTTVTLTFSGGPLPSGGGRRIHVLAGAELVGAEANAATGCLGP